MPLTLNADGRISSPLLNVDSDGDVSGVRNIENTGSVGASDTSHLALPKGTTAQRPVSPANGYIRYNTTEGYIEEYRNGNWNTLSNIFIAEGGTETTYTDGDTTYKVHTFTSSGTFTVLSGTSNVEYVVVAGGGASGSYGAGGGAGGYRSSVSGESSGGGVSAESPLFVGAGDHTVTIGAGGTGVAYAVNLAPNGNNTSFGSITSIGGGGGGLHNIDAGGDATGTNADRIGRSGGSSGGSGRNAEASTGATAGQGYNGGCGNSSSGSACDNGAGGDPKGGGGGGAGAAGANGEFGAGAAGGAGGNGVTTSISGSAVTYAGGGGGHSYDGTGGAGGSGGGGAGGKSLNGTTAGQNGTANTGGGGGGSPAENNGANGGSGIVIIRYAI